ncbi:MAG TPA: hypothetical protein VFL51_13930 [Pseudolabrys sp.]|nr:hypothetical protein [Pseudolabrys sp.]
MMKQPSNDAFARDVQPQTPQFAVTWKYPVNHGFQACVNHAA